MQHQRHIAESIFHMWLHSTLFFFWFLHCAVLETRNVSFHAAGSFRIISRFLRTTVSLRKPYTHATFPLKSKFSKFSKFCTSVGMVPVKILFDRFKFSRFTNWPISDGTGPDIKLLFRRKSTIVKISPTSVGNVDERAFVVRNRFSADYWGRDRSE
jgi:hypothetical protein